MAKFTEEKGILCFVKKNSYIFFYQNGKYFSQSAGHSNLSGPHDTLEKAVKSHYPELSTEEQKEIESADWT